MSTSFRTHTPLLMICLLVPFLGACDAQDPDPVTAMAAEDGTGAAEESDLTEPKPAFDYPGGWFSPDACVDICGVTPGSPVKRPPAVVCFDPTDTECAAKAGNGDYDYLMLSQQWLPSMCMGLAAGYDSTVTHQAGARCLADTPNRLTIHGLWPNYNAGFPQCCGSAQPLSPESLRAWPETLREDLQSFQPDPTTAGFDPAICHIFNHEWQKHGTCFVDTGDVDADAKAYFEVGLAMHEGLVEANTTLDGWAGTTHSLAEIEGLYANAVQVLCDAHQPERLLEIHTCWTRDHEMTDCAPTKGFGSLKACGDRVTLPVWEPQS